MIRNNLILAESGGGFMGIGPARYIADLEHLMKTQLIKYFSLLIGTSVGAIDMSLLACDFSASDVLLFHYNHGKDIFSDKLWAYRLLKNGPKYSDKKINALLKEKLGKRTMSQTKIPLYITAYDARNRKLKVFGPKDTLIPVWYAVRCSMAASTYFSPMCGYSVDCGVFKMNSDGRYIDGGFTANDPLLCGIAAGFIDGYINAENLRLLNLVTSGDTPEISPIKSGWNILTTLKNVIIPALTAGNSADVDFIAKAWLQSMRQPKTNLFRVSPLTQDMQLDDVDESKVIESIWAQQFQKDRDALGQFFNVS